MGPGEDRIVIGEVVGVYGVRGWVRLRSHTEPAENLFDYAPWLIGRAGRWQEYRLAGGRRHGKGLVAGLEGIEDRDQAMRLMGAEIAIRRDQLPDSGPGEFYWTDLEGLRVLDLEGVDLGVVDHLIETGANDVLVVRGERERLIPFVRDQVVTSVDLTAGVIRVDWDPDF